MEEEHGIDNGRRYFAVGIRVIVPSKLRDLVLEELHLGHPRVVRMKALARSPVWWPGLDKELEMLVKAHGGLGGAFATQLSEKE